FELYRKVFGYSIRGAPKWAKSLISEDLIEAMFRRYYNNAAYLIALGLLTLVCCGFTASSLAILLVSRKIPAPLPSYLITIVNSIPLSAIAVFWGACVWALYVV